MPIYEPSASQKPPGQAGEEAEVSPYSSVLGDVIRYYTELVNTKDSEIASLKKTIADHDAPQTKP